MFPRTDIEVKLFADRQLLLFPERREPLLEPFWDWLRGNPRAQHFPRKTLLPWGKEVLPRSVLVVPILDAETHQPVGGIYMVVGNIYSRWDPTDGASLIPALQTLASQIASAQRRTDTYEQLLTHQRLAGELQLAGDIQTSFLPRTLPQISGWDVAASLEPALQTSGDFYDLMILPNGCLGVVIADVADKGLGAALQMALCRTLMRTYMGEHVGHPGKVLRAVNSRILADTVRSTLFVTMFYGILDVRSGEFAYANAGHNPPYLLNGSQPSRLPSEKAIPVGLFERGKWKRNAISLQVGDVLVLYTDGITEAQNRRQDFFGEDRMVEVLNRNRQHSAEVIRAALLREVHRFMNGAPVFDDITMVVIKRV
jgi:serine phosphatase RsbU (regulator of sigma subunit)